MKKYLITLTLLIVVKLSAIAQFSGPGSGTEVSPYLITSASQLNEMRNDLTAHYKLAANIEIGDWIKSNLGTNGWIPIGTEGLPFTGSLEGDGYTISNLYCSRQNNVGLFGVVSNAKIRNFNLSHATMSGGENIGMLIGCSRNSDISNISAKGSVSGTNCVGGLIGKVYDSCTTVGASYGEISNTTSIISCNIESDVNGENYVGGLIGEIYVFTECIMDSKIAREEKRSYNGYWYMHCKIQQNIIDCTFNGNITGGNDVGGAVGYANLDSHTYNDCTFTPTQVSYTYHYYSEAVSKINIENCIILANSIKGNSRLGCIVGGSNGKKLQEVGTIYNHGYDAGPGPSNILSISNCSSNTDLMNSEDYIGGIIGYGHQSIDGLIKNCSSGSNISGNSYIGGVLGWGPFDIEDCSVNGNLRASSFVGGIIGDFGNNIIHCYFSGDIVNSGNYTGGICGNTCKYIKQCVVSSDKIFGVKYIGRISGGYNETLNNFANVMCDVKSNGYSIEVPDDEYNGYGVANDNLKSKAFYQGLSWDMDNIWNLLPGVSLPYHRYQSCPPIISNIINSESLYVHGTCNDDGPLFVKSNNTIAKYEVSQNNWQFSTSPTKHLCIYSLGAGKHPSIPICRNIEVIATELSLSYGTVKIGVGQSEELIPKIKPLNADVDIIWETSDANVATVNTNGVVTGLNSGSCTITCRDKISGLYAQCKVIVIIKVKSVEISPKEIDMELNTNIYLHVTILPENASDKSIKWTSTNPNIASVDEYGNVRANDYGTTFIVAQATDGLFSDMCKINVIKHVESVIITEKEISMIENETHMLTTVILPHDATNKNLYWESSNPVVATVSEGLVKALSKGNTIITVKTEDGNYSDICIVLVNLNSGTEDIVTDNASDWFNPSQPYEVYNLSGMMVGTDIENIAAGIYIIRQGSKAYKITVK